MSPKAKPAMSRRQRRAIAKATGQPMKGARTVLVDRLAFPRETLLASDDPISTLLAFIGEWLEDAENNSGADLFEETSIRFGRHPSPAFDGEVVIELQTVKKEGMVDLVGPAPIDDEPIVDRCGFVGKAGLACTVVDVIEADGSLPKHRHRYPADDLVREIEEEERSVSTETFEEAPE